MEHSFEGIPTVPPRKDVAHMAFFFNGKRYRVSATPNMTAREVKQALWAGGIAQGASGLKDWNDLVRAMRAADAAADAAAAGAAVAAAAAASAPSQACVPRQ